MNVVDDNEGHFGFFGIGGGEDQRLLSVDIGGGRVAVANPESLMVQNFGGINAVSITHSRRKTIDMNRMKRSWTVPGLSRKSCRWNEENLSKRRKRANLIPQEAKQVAKEAYIIGFPAGVNQFAHNRKQK